MSVSSRPGRAFSYFRKERSLPYGVEGASNGAANSFVVIRDGEIVEPSDMPGKVSGFALRPGDIVREETAGGGGYGDLLEREPEKVLADVAENYLSEADAEARFGVVIHGVEVDGAATKARRQAMSEERITVTLELSNEELADGPRRQFAVPRALADRIGISNGDLVELVTGRGAPLSVDDDRWRRGSRRRQFYQYGYHGHRTRRPRAFARDGFATRNSSMSRDNG